MADFREMPPPRGVVERVVRLALAEDLGRGDVTTEACIGPGVRGEALVRARKPLVLSGLEVIKEVYKQVDPTVEVRNLRLDWADGQSQADTERHGSTSDAGGRSFGCPRRG